MQNLVLGFRSMRSVRVLKGVALAIVCSAATMADAPAGAAPPLPSPVPSAPPAPAPGPVPRQPPAPTPTIPPRLTIPKDPAPPRPTSGPPAPRYQQWRSAFANSDFEAADLQGWQLLPTAPGVPPTFARKTTLHATKMTSDIQIAGKPATSLGGDYWNVPVPVQNGSVGQTGDYWLETAGGQGALLSPAFKLNADDRFVSFLFRRPSGGTVPVGLSAGSTTLVQKAFTLPGGTMQAVVLDVSAVPADKRDSVQIVLPLVLPGDGIDSILVWRSQPNPTDLVGPVNAQTMSGVWGVADLHAHLFNQIGFGGRLFAGSIHSSLDHTGLKMGTSPRTGRPYSDSASTMADAIPNCHPNHGTDPGGHGTLTLFPEGGHDAGGFPGFKGWPRYSTLQHQQAYVDWLKRAWQGGLRLVHVDVGNSKLMADLYGGVMSGLTVGSNWNPTDDGWATTAELNAMHAFVTLPDVKDWVEIALNPVDARRIISQGKLAFVLGVEVDDIDNLSAQLKPLAPSAQRPIIKAHLKALFDKGVRHLLPVHVAENVFGSPAVYELAFDIGNLFGPNHRLFPVRNAFGSGIRTRLDWAVQEKIGSNTSNPKSPEGWFLKALLNAADPNTRAQLNTAFPTGTIGHAHAEGLSQTGKILIQEAMRLGMVIDVDHMSDLSVDDTLNIVKPLSYPIVSSHTGFRDLAFGSWKKVNGTFVENTDTAYGPATREMFGVDNAEPMAKERDRSLTHLNAIAELGGMVGVGTGAAALPVKWPKNGSGPEQNCDGSPTVFAQSLLYAIDKMAGRGGIALGTDVNGLNGMTNPRFGPFACAHAEGDTIRKRDLRLQVASQKNPVRYKSLGITDTMTTLPVTVKSFSQERFYSPSSAYDDDEKVAWQGIARWKAGVHPPPGNNFDPTATQAQAVVNLAWGLFQGTKKTAGSLPIGMRPNRGWPDTLVTMRAGWDLAAGQLMKNEKNDQDLMRFEGKLQRVWADWQRMEAGTNPPLEKSLAGEADFDINLDGFAHYGLLPDFLQDVRNIGITPQQMAPLFNSAEAYLRMWQKIETQKVIALTKPDN